MKWFCSFKAFGDLVIACNYIRRLDTAKNGILAGSHLKPLLAAIRFEGVVQIIDIGSEVPALFDIKKHGYIQAVRSGFSIRKEMKKIIRSHQDILVFDEIRGRQRFLAAGMQAEMVKQGECNIYIDYARYLNFSSVEGKLATVACDTISCVHIFPDSRVKAKTIPDSLILKIAEKNFSKGKNTIVVKIGKPVPLPQLSLLQVQWVDCFEQLFRIISSAKAMVSADSLPAHLAEYCNVPVFVFTPVPNNYWMPLSSLENNSYSVFESLCRYDKWI